MTAIEVVAGVTIGTLIAWLALFWLIGALDVWVDPDWERDEGLVALGDDAAPVDGHKDPSA